MQLQGRTTRNAVLRHTKTGKAVLGISIADNDATNYGIKYYDVTAWEELAEQTGNIREGIPLRITGVLAGTKPYQKKDGTQGTAYQFTATKIEPLSFDALSTQYPTHAQAVNRFNEDAAMTELDVPF